MKRIFFWLKPYRLSLSVIVFANILSIIFSIFSLSLLAPFLMLLFDKVPLVVEKPELIFSSESVLNWFNYYVSQIIQTQGKQAALFLISALVLGAFLLKNILDYTANWLMVPIRNGVLRDMRNKLYEKILILPVSFFSKEKKGDIMSRCISDVQEVEVMILRSLQQIFREPLTVLFYLTALFFINYKLTFFVLLILPIGAAIIGLISRKLRKKSVEAKDRMGQLMSMTEESISGLRVIKAFNAIWNAENIFQKRNEKYTKLMIKIYRKVDLSSPMSEFLGTILVMVIMIFGGNMVINGNGELPAELFITYIALFSQIINPGKTISVASYNFRKGMSSLDRIDYVLNADEKIIEKDNAVEISDFIDKIEVKNLYFKYEEDYVLKDINLNIEKGKIYAICGHSGSGKTTFTDLLSRFYDINEGEILIDGISTKDFKINDLRSLFGIVTQDTVLFNDTLFNNIAFGKPETPMEDVKKASIAANAMEFANQLPNGFDTVIGDRGVTLSGGQRQRISIARALLKNPPILILDEATSALDTESEKLVQSALANIMKEKTSLVIAHRLSTIKDADEILVFNEGEIAERGTHDELMEKRGIYHKLVEMQSFVE